jgi:NAD(P)-dependent dehydrogenase (short-subunit alcohol dehydrogenase family)
MTAGTTRRLALITGASRGLGEVVAGWLAGEGFDLILNARDEAALGAVAETVRSLGGAVVGVSGDVSHPDVRARLARATERFPGLDLLINNAATLGRTPLRPLSEVTPAELEEVYRTNVVAPIALVQAVLPSLARRQGLVVNISSDAARGGYPTWGNYGASKAALDLASLTFAHELAPTGVSVVSVDPGDMRTPGARPAFPPEEFAARPPPGATLPFWAWLLGQPAREISGRRFEAQSALWGSSP